MAYGTDKHDDYFHEMGEKAQAGELLEHELAHLREELDAMAAKGTLTAELKVLRRDLAAAQAASAAPAAAQAAPAGARREGRERLMEALLLGIYSFFVWLIFIKFKWLPWNTTSQVTVVIIPIVAMTALILTLNVVAPSIGRRPRHQVRRAGDPAGARAGDRGAGRAQPAGEEGRAAVPHRPDASTRTISTSPRPSSPPTRRSSRRPARAWSMPRPARGNCRSS